MKQFYISAWVLVVFAAFVTVLTGYLNPVTAVAFSLIVLGLVYGFALWSVMTNTPDMPQVFDRNS